MSTGRGPWHGARRTPLPGTKKGSHLKVVPDRLRKEDRHVGLEDETHTVRVVPKLHDACRHALYTSHPVRACTRCRWLYGIDDPETRWFDFWADHGEDR